MATQPIVENISAEQVASALFYRLCKDTKLVREYLSDLHENLGLTKTQVRKLKIRDIVSLLKEAVDKHLPKLEKNIVEAEPEEEDDEETGGDDEETGGDDEETGGDEWMWFCHRKNHGMEECCGNCDRWYCKCSDEDGDPIRDGTVLKCESCGMDKPANAEAEAKSKANPKIAVQAGSKVVTCTMGGSSHKVEKNGKEAVTGDETDVDEETVEERVDENGTYIPRSDEWYYGEIPADCTRQRLVKIMAKALLKFQEDEKLWTDLEDDLSQIAADRIGFWLMADSWECEYALFAHLVPDEEYKDFTAEVVAKAERIKARKSK